MYRLIVESLLGLSRSGATLRVAPCLPATWPGFKLHYRHGETTYLIAVRRGKLAGAPATVSLDGVALPDATIPLRDDQVAHEVEIVVDAGDADAA
jgi:cellobiose phosphorylase